jgi:hypothetical protein
MGCLRRQCTPDLFISSYPNFMDMADTCGNPSWSSQSLLIIIIHVLVLVMMTHTAQLVQRLLSGVLKLGLHGNHGSSKGDVAQPQPIY